jgi:hypothetical protein
MQMLVAYTNLSDTEVPQVCPVIGLDGRSVQLRVSTPNHVGSAVKIEADDTMSLGEVSYCRPEGEGYVVWVELAQALHHVDELSRLARALLT